MEDFRSEKTRKKSFIDCAKRRLLEDSRTYTSGSSRISTWRLFHHEIVKELPSFSKTVQYKKS